LPETNADGANKKESTSFAVFVRQARIEGKTMAPPVPVDYGMDYDFEKAMAWLTSTNKKEEDESIHKKEEDESVDSHPSENELLLTQYNEMKKKEEKAIALLKSNKEEDESVDSHPSENELLLTRYNEMLKKEEEDKENKKLANVKKVCKFCERFPCVLNRNLLYEEMMFIADGFEDSGLSNKQKRHELYVFVAKKLFGYLGRGNRKEIPGCVMAEIHDTFPKEKGTEYIGFKEAGKDE
jgi:hypothetical protein